MRQPAAAAAGDEYDEGSDASSSGEGEMDEELGVDELLEKAAAEVRGLVKLLKESHCMHLIMQLGSSRDVHIRARPVPGRPWLLALARGHWMRLSSACHLDVTEVGAAAAGVVAGVPAGGCQGQEEVFSQE
jgi:hypothetical protein